MFIDFLDVTKKSKLNQFRVCMAQRLHPFFHVPSGTNTRHSEHFVQTLSSIHVQASLEPPRLFHDDVTSTFRENGQGTQPNLLPVPEQNTTNIVN